MRILRVLGLVGLILVASLMPASSGRAGARVIERREAEASWSLPDKTGRHDFINYWVWARRVTAIGGATWTRVRLTRYVCDYEMRNMTLCEPTRSLEKNIPNRAFEVDEQLQRASLRFRAFGERQEARWRADGDLSSSGMAAYCHDDRPIPEMYEGIHRPSESWGRVFGKRLTPADITVWDFADIIFMVGVQHCGPPVGPNPPAG